MFLSFSKLQLDTRSRFSLILILLVRSITLESAKTRTLGLLIFTTLQLYKRIILILSNVM